MQLRNVGKNYNYIYPWWSTDKKYWLGWYFCPTTVLNYRTNVKVNIVNAVRIESTMSNQKNVEINQN